MSIMYIMYMWTCHTLAVLFGEWCADQTDVRASVENCWELIPFSLAKAGPTRGGFVRVQVFGEYL